MLELFALGGPEGLTQIGPITGYVRAEIIERDLGAGGWLVELPLDEGGAVASRLLGETWPGLEAWDPETGWRFGGFLTDATLVVDDSGVETARFRGSDFQALLDDRLDWPIFNDATLWWSGVYGGTIPLTSDAHNMVFTNAGAGALAGRRIAGLVQGDDPNAGPPKARRLKGLPLLEVLRGMFSTEAWTARLRLTRDPATGAGSLLFETPAREVAQMVLDARAGTLGSMEYTLSASAATMVIAMGDLLGMDPVERRVVQSVTAADSWRKRYREQFINRPGSDNDLALGDEATAVLFERLLPTAVKADQARVDGFGSRIDLGWLVDVRTGASFGATTARAPVVASTASFDPRTGWVRTVDIGTETLAGPAALMSNLARIARRARQIEADLLP
jgi:hypothetical protein